MQMKHKIEISILHLLIMPLYINMCALQAQEAIITTGGNQAGTGGTVSYTVGQFAYTAFTSSMGTITQGVQQPYEILIVTGIKEALPISLEFSAYPNPTSDYLRLKVENYKIENLSCQLFDVMGHLLQNVEIVGKETDIQTGSLLPSTYILKVIDKQKEVRTFKIIKN